MKLTRLICRLAAERFKDTAELGVRLSPVDLTIEEAVELVNSARDQLGPGTRIAVAAPGAPEVDGEHATLSSGERAAERATSWRNSIDPDAGERVLYVSVELQGKAGGLRDTFEEVSEPDLRRVFAEWCQTEPEGLPRALTRALGSADFVERVPARALCAYVSAVGAVEDEEEQWQVASEQLPLLSLARDSALRDSVAKRLAANASLVGAAVRQDRRGTTRLSAAAKNKHSKLVEAVGQAAGVPTQQLSRVDLGDIDTHELEPTRSLAPAARTTVTSRKPSGKGPTTAPPTKKGSRASQQSPPAKAPPLALPAPVPRAQVEAEARVQAALEEVTAQAPPPRPPSPRQGSLQRPSPLPPPPASPPPVAPAPAAQPWSEQLHRTEFGSTAAVLPAGLERLLAESLARGPGALSWTLPSGPLHRLLHRLPAQVADPHHDQLDQLPTEHEQFHRALESITRARRQLVSHLTTGRRSSLLPRLVQAPLLLLTDPELAGLVEELVTEADALLQAALDTKDLDVVGRVLGAETLRLCSEADEEELVILSPLHPLWLGQIWSRWKLLDQAASLSPLDRRLLVRSLAVHPAGPQAWPSSDSVASHWLPSSPESHGLLIFANRSAAAHRHDLQATGQALLRTLFELSPHARQRPVTLVEGPGAGSVASGLLDAILGADEVEELTIYLDGEAASELGVQRVDRLRLRPVPTDPERVAQLHPHLHVHVTEPAPPPTAKDPASSRAGVPAAPGLLRQHRTVDNGCLTRTLNTLGCIGVEPTARALDLLSGGRGAAELTSTHCLVHLEAAVSPLPQDSATLHVIIGPSLGRKPPRRQYLLAHERIGELSVAVTTGDLRSMTAKLARSYAQLGVADQRTSTQRRLTRQLLARSTHGLLSLDGAHGEPLTRELLAAAVEAALPAATVATLSRADVVALAGTTGADAVPGPTLLAASHTGQTLKLVLGTAVPNPTSAFSLDGSQLTGTGATVLGRALQTLATASCLETLGGHCARELLTTLLVRPMLDQEPQPRLLASLDSSTDLDVEVSLLLLVSTSSVLATASGEIRLRGCGKVEVITQSQELLERVLIRV